MRSPEPSRRSSPRFRVSATWT
uniref:Uncharacterized protein n=1 Tax=Arundo donax TaxID=35708 RepID=A0A0A9ABR0_ARUDO